MIRRYYKSLISMQFAVPEFANAIIVFLFAFMYFRTGNELFRYVGIAAGIILLLQIAFVKLRKEQVGNQLRNIKHVEKYYDDGAMLGKSFVLKDKILLCDEKLKITELPVTPIARMEVKDSGKNKKEITIQANDTYTFVVDNEIQATRFAAFLMKNNIGMDLVGVEPSGTGTFNELKSE